MDLNELKAIISRGEDSRHQFKEDVRNHVSLAAEMVAFSLLLLNGHSLTLSVKRKFQGKVTL